MADRHAGLVDSGGSLREADALDPPADALDEGLPADLGGPLQEPVGATPVRSGYPSGHRRGAVKRAAAAGDVRFRVAAAHAMVAGVQAGHRSARRRGWPRARGVLPPARPLRPAGRRRWLAEPGWPGCGKVAGPVAVAVGTGLVACILVQVLSAALAAAVQRQWRLLGTALAMPAYMLLISLATYRALWHLFRQPHIWEKTPHGLSGHDTDPGIAP